MLLVPRKSIKQRRCTWSTHSHCRICQPYSPPLCRPPLVVQPHSLHSSHNLELLLWNKCGATSQATSDGQYPWCAIATYS